MKSLIEKRVAQLLDSDIRKVLQQRQVGLEKESLRVAADGGIAQTAHSARLGAALTHPSITTDYSEALLELVTPPFQHFKTYPGQSVPSYALLQKKIILT